jgi:MYXO-CTERM domain-containing protein
MHGHARLAAGINLAGPLTFWAGSSNSENSLNIDLVNLLGGPGPGSLPEAASDAVTLLESGSEPPPTSAPSPAAGGLFAAALAALATLRRRRPDGDG